MLTICAEPPIYMSTMMTFLRRMEHNFNYDAFRKMLDTLRLKNDQRIMLDLRLELLDSCITTEPDARRAATFFKPGHLTIVEYVSHVSIYATSY